MIANLGQGAYGKVVKVKTKETGNEYAMKIVPKQLIENLKMMDQLKNEVNIMSMIKHQNIIELKSYFEDHRNIYFILEIADDKHLYQRLKLKGKYPENEAACFLFEVFKGLNYLHTRSPCIIHRDIKPENILFVNGRAKLADFGWCNLKDGVRVTYCGTPDYLAPEMVRENGHTEKLDIWTMGVLAFELLNGKAPFAPSNTVKDKKRAQEILEENILNNYPIFCKENLSKEARDIVSSMLQKEPTLRPSAGELLNHAWFKLQLPQRFPPPATNTPQTRRLTAASTQKMPSPSPKPQTPPSSKKAQISKSKPGTPLSINAPLIKFPSEKSMKPITKFDLPPEA